MAKSASDAVDLIACNANTDTGAAQDDSSAAGG